jgi:hypothetical protein
MNENQIIDETGFKSPSHWQEKFPNKSKEEIERLYAQRVKDPYVKKKKIKPLMISVFSKSPNTWFHDIMENGKGRDPGYFHIFLGVNSRFAVVLPLQNKNAQSVLGTLRKFVTEHKPIKLTSDEDAAFLSSTVLDYLSEQKVRVQTIPDQNHGAMGTLNRFIRTLRDMNTPREMDTRDSTDEEFKWFTKEKMDDLVRKYNNTFHDGIQMKPIEMHTDIDKEEEYIFKMMEKRDKQEKKLAPKQLKPGDKVRVILPMAGYLTKKRYRYSPEYYVVVEKDGKMWSIKSADARTITRPFYLLRKLDKVEEAKMRHAKTIPGKWQGAIKSVGADAGNNRVHVIFEGEDGRDYPDIIPKRNLLSRFDRSGIDPK